MSDPSALPLDHRLPYASAYHAFQARAGRAPAALAAKDGERAWSFRELETASRRSGRALMALGLEPGEMASVWAVNHVEWVIAALGLQAAGGALIPAGTRLKPPEVALLLRRARARILFCDPGFGAVDFVAGILAESLPELRQIVVFDDIPALPRVMGWQAFLALADDVPEPNLEARIAALCPETLADVIFTSGTTGVPKGVPMTHGQSLVACEQQQLCVTRFRAGDMFAITYPFAHNAGYRAGWQASLLFGATFLALRNLDTGLLLQTIAREGVTVLPAVPTVFQGLLDHPDFAHTDVSKMRFAATGATTIPVVLIERMQAAFGPAAVVTGYGLTETAGSVSSTRPGDSAAVIATTTGRVLDNLDVRLIDMDGAEVAPGTPGEIAVRGPQVMRAYFEDPVGTAAAFTADGYLRTGDVGVFDAFGNLSITDRIKDMFIVGGFNAYPAEIEQQLSRIEGVAEAAVIGIDDARLGQVGRAFVIRRPDAALDEAAVVAWCRQAMANYKVPRVVTFVDELPRSPTGKVSKVHLRGLA